MNTRELVKAIKGNEPFESGNLSAVVYDFGTDNASYVIMLKGVAIYRENLDTTDYAFIRDTAIVPKRVENAIIKAKFTW